MTRQIILDTETTGLEPDSHRIIEIGCIEIVNRRPTGNRYHQYLNPDREVDAGAVAVHGLSNEFLADKPRFNDIVDDLLSFLKGAELIIHNAAFDVGFLNAEFRRSGEQYGQVADHCGVLDTLMLARKLHPGQKNSLDALCKRYDVDNSHRDLHGALLDAEILLDVYLRMTGGQGSLALGGQDGAGGAQAGVIRRLPGNRARLPVLHATAQELEAHEARLAALDKASGGRTLWRQLNAAEPTGQ